MPPIHPTPPPTNLKTMKHLITAILLMVTALVSAQSAKHATARIFESGNKNHSRITLVYETGESEIIQLEPWNSFSLEKSNEAHIQNQTTINKLINGMAEKGYEISHMTSTFEGFLYTFIVFNKRD